MTRLTRKEVKFEWNDLCERAFQELKRRLTLAPILIVSEQGQYNAPKIPYNFYNNFIISLGYKSSQMGIFQELIND